jgi:hypothetical protein
MVLGFSLLQVPGTISLEPEAETGLSPPSSADFKNGWFNTSLHCVLIIKVEEQLYIYKIYRLHPVVYIIFILWYVSTGIT